MMDDIERLGDPTPDTDASPHTDTNEPPLSISETCPEDAITDCHQGNVWCFSASMTPIDPLYECVNGDCDQGACSCEPNWWGVRCHIATDCNAVPNFTFCGAQDATVADPQWSYQVCYNDHCVTPGDCGTTACNTQGIHFPLGQLTSPWFTSVTDHDSKETVVIDHNTDLTWMHCPAGQHGDLCDTGHVQSMEWHQSVAFCDALVHAGMNDWYLPSEFELLSIVDYQRDDTPKIDLDVFPRTPATGFWTSTTWRDPDYAKRVLFFDGLVRGNQPDAPAGQQGLKTETHPVRCVRREGTPAIQTRFLRPHLSQDEDTPVVEDHLTDRTWMGCPAGLRGADCDQGSQLSGTLQDAIHFCDTSTWGAFDDWRLPWPIELFSVFGSRDYFPNLPETDYWSIPFSSDATGGYYVSLDDNWIIGGRSADTPHPFLCVRDNRKSP